MGGRAGVRGMRITAALVVNLVANGMSTADIIREYLELERGRHPPVPAIRFRAAERRDRTLQKPCRVRFPADMGGSLTTGGSVARG